jgi:hypothetical protein
MASSCGTGQWSESANRVGSVDQRKAILPLECKRHEFQLNPETNGDEIADALVMFRQTQARIECLWMDFVSSSLVNGTEAGGSNSSDASFSINRETKRLQRIEDKIRRSLEQVMLGSTSAPRTKAETEGLHVCSRDWPRSSSSEVLLMTTDSSGSTDKHRNKKWDSFCNGPQQTDGNSDEVSTLNMSRISSLSAGSSKRFFASKGRARRLRAWRIVVDLAEVLFGNDTYYVISVFGKTPRDFQRNYQGSFCFFLVVAIILGEACEESLLFDAAAKWFLVALSAALISGGQIHAPHSIDEVTLAFVLLVGYHVWVVMSFHQIS